ncbi:hypothetical protein, partial [Cohnella sp. GbtcB17]|uniref:hypothetical protein n=1 Tax=Cohnella sp. GbtcB17 TaxID=2824762 RepID=UPI001C310646
VGDRCTFGYLPPLVPFFHPHQSASPCPVQAFLYALRQKYQSEYHTCFGQALPGKSGETEFVFTK